MDEKKKEDLFEELQLFSQFIWGKHEFQITDDDIEDYVELIENNSE